MKLLGTNLKDYIAVFENVVPNSDCMFIKGEYGNDSLLRPAILSGKPEESSYHDSNYRRVLDLNISDPYVISRNKTYRAKIEKILLKHVKLIVTKYGEEVSNQFNVTDASELTYLKYKKGDYYNSHTDDSTKNRRVLSLIFALNDDFEGGEFEFFKEDKYILKQPMGSVLVFPSNFLYPHNVCELKNGEKHSIIIWIT